MKPGTFLYLVGSISTGIAVAPPPPSEEKPPSAPRGDSGRAQELGEVGQRPLHPLLDRLFAEPPGAPCFLSGLALEDGRHHQRRGGIPELPLNRLEELGGAPARGREVGELLALGV